MKNLSDLKQMFMDQVKLSDIKYSWDGGHSYSYIDHPLCDIDVVCELLSQEDRDEYEDFVNEWLYDNDDCPPCEIEIVDGEVCSGCGCHDHLDYVKDREEVEDIINELMNY